MLWNPHPPNSRLVFHSRSTYHSIIQVLLLHVICTYIHTYRTVRVYLHMKPGNCAHALD